MKRERGKLLGGIKMKGPVSIMCPSVFPPAASFCDFIRTTDDK